MLRARAGAREVLFALGAGDTAIATLAIVLAPGGKWKAATRLANLVAGTGAASASLAWQHVRKWGRQ